MKPRELVKEMENVGLTLDKTTQTSLMAMYGEAGGLQAEDLLDNLEKPDASSFGDLDKAEFIYDYSCKLGLRLEDAAVASMIGFYGRNQKIRHSQEVFASAAASSRIGSNVFSSMIDAFCKCGKVDEANSLFREIVEQGHSQDAVTISVLVNALTKHGKYQEAECIIHDNLNQGTELDTVAYNTFIKSMLDAGILPSIHTYNTMISVYGQGGKVRQGCWGNVYEAQKSGLSLWMRKLIQNMIGYYGRLDLTMKLRIFSRHEKNGHSPDTTYLSCTGLGAYTEAEKHSKAEEVISRMQNERIPPSCAHFNHLIFALAREGSVAEAKRVYCQMRQAGLNPDLACCRTMMRTYLDYGLVKEGISFFESVNSFVKPDGFVLSAAIHLYKFLGKESEAQDILEKISLCRLLFIRNLRVGSKSIAS
ncbi:hypothetical protein J5N97_024929 [Dioscorea zingiberensis]|uniref:Pentatricopeptide repeat-containing protein n=1 Tax=Dioscorea zingiberensis TaxID=325984 RepID=A0A9D5H9C6_9LILI|nr:hypothetical protein J5N97_024929 [Dioscorea zingiberensis]